MPALRKTRALAHRVAAKTKSPRWARTAHLDRRGLTLDGELLPYYIGPDVEVTHLDANLDRIDLSIYAERFSHGSLHHGVSLTLRSEVGG